MVAVDSNVLVRLIAQGDPSQTRVAKTFVHNGVWVSTLALAEAIWVLRSVFGFDAQHLSNSIEVLLEHDSVILQDATAVADALEIFRAKPVLKFADCLILALARASGHLPLGTFDRALAKVDGAHKL
jgi:predicted nucleic-acid-binding protein